MLILWALTEPGTILRAYGVRPALISSTKGCTKFKRVDDSRVRGIVSVFQGAASMSNNGQRNNVRTGKVLASIGGCLAAASIWFYCFPGTWMDVVQDSRGRAEFHLFVLGLWFLAPPIWFVYEMQFYKWTPAEKEELRRTQELFSRVWIAVSALLGFLWNQFGSKIL
jgi:hypothetical protein